MAKTTRSDRVKLALERLLEDEDVQAQLRTAATRSREAWARAAGRRPSKAVEDKKLYAKVREAATSLTRAGRSLRAKPEPPKRRGRKVVLVVVASGAAALALKKRKGMTKESSQTGATTPDTPPPVPEEGPERSAA
jgi:ferric-dicitrate binding protein FerR (iron transport regulator)